MGWVNLSDLVTESLQANPLPIAAGGTGINNMADVVVDQGTSGIWSYRKWASGRAEAWGHWSGVYGSAVSGGNYGSKKIDLPFTFVTKNSSHVSKGYNAYKVNDCYDNPGDAVYKPNCTSVDLVFYLKSAYSISANETIGFSFYVEGTWK